MIGDNFLWFPEKGGTKIEGETEDVFFAQKKAFEVLNFQFVMDNKESVDSDTAKGSVAGKAKFQEFEVEKRVDSASVTLYRACSLGTLIPSAMLASRKASGGGELIYLQYIFRYVHVTGVTWSGGPGEDVAHEKVTFTFKAMGLQYIQQKSDGGIGRRQSWSWNTATQGGKSGTPSLELEGIEGPPDFLPGRP